MLYVYAVVELIQHRKWLPYQQSVQQPVMGELLLFTKLWKGQNIFYGELTEVYSESGNTVQIFVGNTKILTFAFSQAGLLPFLLKLELQIRRGIRHNSEKCFLISQQKYTVLPLIRTISARWL